MPEGVIIEDSGRPGPTIGIMGGVHGTEHVGVETVRWARSNIRPTAGRIIFIEGNPRAIERGVRYLDKDLNACFSRTSDIRTVEGKRAHELMPVLDMCDALLDIHASMSRVAAPFVICEEPGFAFAKTLDFPIITMGWDALDPAASDAYMNAQEKIGVGIECGSIHNVDEVLPLAKRSAARFAQFFGVTGGGFIPSKTQGRLIRVYTSIDQTEKPIAFKREYEDFAPLMAGEIFAQAGDVSYVASEGDRIIFARPNAPVGSDAFILGKEIES